jgi:elongation factor Ts
MMNVTAGMVKELRDKTGAGMMDCKNALAETKGDIEAAVDWLRTRGLAKAAKKAGRVAAEGLIGVEAAGDAGAMVEINSETDFVARNDQFKDFVKSAAKAALVVEGDVDRLLKHAPDGDRRLQDMINDMIAKIGENMSIRRAVAIGVSPGVVASYVHNAVAPDLGKIGVLVALESSAEPTKLATLGKQLAMHVAATNPIALSIDVLPPDVVARERAIYSEQARESGKPENVIAKMVEGRMRKFYEESVLLSQVFVIDNETPVAKVLENASKELGTKVAITGFARYAVGEGVEKPTADFAAEVAAAARPSSEGPA